MKKRTFLWWLCLWFTGIGPAFAQKPDTAALNYTEGMPKLQMQRANENYAAWGPQNAIGKGTPLGLRLKYLSLGPKAHVSIGGEARYLAEVFQNNGWDEANGSTFWLVQRYVLHTDWHLGPVRLFAQLHSASLTLSQQEPRGVDRDDLDFHQLFVELSQQIGANTLKARVGRQEMALGSQRLFSLREGPNVRLGFDLARLFYESPRIQWQAFYGWRVQNQVGVFDNAVSTNEAVWGLYAVVPQALGKLGLDVYYLGFDSPDRVYSEGTAWETRHSVGARVWKDASPGSPLEVNAEALYQFGSFGSGRINAYTASADLKYHTDWANNATLGLKVDLISGDRNLGDGHLETFNALYPRGAYFGLIALLGPSNLFDVHPAVGFALNTDLMLTFDWDVFWRWQLEDGIYGPNVAPERGPGQSTAHYLGHQPGFEFAYDHGRYWAFSFEGSVFFPGPYFAQTGTNNVVMHLAASTRFKF